jgi:uncharacterized membrane protein (DUF373 family)
MLKDELATARARWAPLNFYQRFEDIVVFILTAIIAVIIAFTVWDLCVKVIEALLSARGLNPTDYAVFQSIFGMIFTVIIALEFKKSLLVLAERGESIVQVRTVVLIALLAALRKLIILEPGDVDASYLFALAAVILALGGVYWLVRDQEERRTQKKALGPRGKSEAKP